VMERQNIRSGAQPIENPLLLLVSAPYFFLQDEYLIICALDLRWTCAGLVALLIWARTIRICILA